MRTLAHISDLHFGQLDEQGATPSSGHHLWSDTTVAARAEWALTPILHLEFQANAIFPLTRYRYLFLSPDTPAGEVPAVAGGATFGGVMHFP